MSSHIIKFLGIIDHVLIQHTFNRLRRNAGLVDHKINIFIVVFDNINAGRKMQYQIFFCDISDRWK